MRVPPKNRWKATASSGAPRSRRRRSLRDDLDFEAVEETWLKIDLGETATLAGLGSLLGQAGAGAYGFESSLDGKSWAIFARLATARADRTSLRSLLSPPGSCAGLAASPNRSGARRLSKSIFTAPPTQRR